MGWASWNCFRTNINEEKLKRQFDALVKTGLAACGYVYANTDDGFFGGRAADGTLLYHKERFPNGIKPLADYAHSLGLKAGIYSEAGRASCGHYFDNEGENGVDVGLVGRERQELENYLVYCNFDFIKVDWCGALREGVDEREVYAGLRRGEVLALSMDDIDLRADVIHVTKAVRFDGNQPVLSDPKTEAGRRDVPILSALRPFLVDHVGLIAPSASGSIMSESAFDRAFQSYLSALSAAAGHPVRIRCHDFRHTYCTMLVDAGVPLKQAMAWLGHADEKMILRIYDHVRASRTSASVDLVEKHLAAPPDNVIRIG